MARELTNRAVRFSDHVARLMFDERDLQSVLDLCADDHVRILHNSGGIEVPNDQADASARDIIHAEETISWTNTPIAVRGDLLCLTRNRYRRSETGFGSDILQVGEINPEGLATRTARFDAEDLNAAHDCLNQWWLEGLPPRLAEPASLGVKLARSHERGDGAALAEVLSDALTYNDHRRLRQPKQNRQELLDWWATRYATSPGFVAIAPSIERLTSEGMVATTNAVSPEGFITSGVMAYLVQSAEITHLEHFDGSDLDTALARFDELTS